MMPSPTPPPAEPSLAPPGAGLPKVELVVARALFRWQAFTTSRADAAAAIVSGRDTIAALARRHDAAEGSRRVLIDRLRGLEDSSRYWSVFMTVTHLRIVNSGIVATVTQLLAGQVPTRVASTAAVKPDPAADATEIAKFEHTCDDLLALNRAAPTLPTRGRYAHPWFGPLNAADWFFLAGFHMVLHRRQIERIQAGLTLPPAPPPAAT